MIKPPKILPDNKNIFWALMGLSFFLLTLTVCFSILTGKISSFSANSDGFSLNYITPDDALDLVKKEEKAYEMVKALLDREKEMQKKISEYENNPVFKLGFIPKPETPDVSKTVSLGDKPINVSELGELVKTREEESKDARVRIETIRQINQQQRQAQSMPQQQQQIGSTK